MRSSYRDDNIPAYKHRLWYQFFLKKVLQVML